MINNHKIRSLLVTALFAFGSLFALTAEAQQLEDENYSDIDRYKAIIMCMTVEYVQFYQEHPAEEDVMDICQSRFNRLSDDIPYEQYKNWVLETPYTPYPSVETSAILEQYHRIMLGLDPEMSIIN
ncbi:MAG: hypothetical protein Q4G44_05530 [Alcaligenaceae bacterium]|nr:hypothetical protein [Alcaligenaceae bacterium]